MKHKELHINFTETNPEDVYIKAELKPNSKSYEIFFRSNDIILTKNTEVLLAVGLLPAMKTGSTLVVEGTISQKLFNALEPIRTSFHTLNPHLKKIKIKNLVPRPANLPKENRMGMFFSAGVDSFYSLLKLKDEITDLVFIHGFDFSLSSYARREKMSQIVRKIGAHFGKRVIEIESNLRLFIQRSFQKPNLLWIDSAGLFRISVAHLLSPFFRRIYFPDAHDPPWGTETLEFFHDGCAATRVEKVAFISQSEVALQNLQVCRENTAVLNASWQTGIGDSATLYNCGSCEKCIRTMINLHIAGALERCPTLPNKVDLKKISQTRIHNTGERVFVEESLAALRNRPADRDLYNALHKIWKQSWWVSFEAKYPRLFRIRWIYRILRGMGRFSGKFLGKIKRIWFII
jgi:hypothetical protein